MKNLGSIISVAMLFLLYALYQNVKVENPQTMIKAESHATSQELARELARACKAKDPKACRSYEKICAGDQELECQTF